MTIKLFNDCHKGHIAIHVLPGLSFYRTSYLTEIALSWLIWTLEIRAEPKEQPEDSVDNAVEAHMRDMELKDE